MVPLLWVGHRAPGQKGPPQEGGPAAALLQHSEVDMEGQGPRVPPERLLDDPQLVRVGNGKDMLSLPVGQAVEGQLEGFFEQQRQPLGQSVALRDDAHLGGGEGIAVK